MNFKEKVQSMTAKEIIMAMVDSLVRPPLVHVDMASWGDARRTWRTLFLTKTCFGCAATNTICQISGVKFTPENIENRAGALNTEAIFLNNFENAINALRQGSIPAYNAYAECAGFALIKTSPGTVTLPTLENNYKNFELDAYKWLANQQD